MAQCFNNKICLLNLLSNLANWSASPNPAPIPPKKHHRASYGELFTKLFTKESLVELFPNSASEYEAAEESESSVWMKSPIQNSDEHTCVYIAAQADRRQTAADCSVCLLTVYRERAIWQTPFAGNALSERVFRVCEIFANCLDARGQTNFGKLAKLGELMLVRRLIKPCRRIIGTGSWRALPNTITTLHFGEVRDVCLSAAMPAAAIVHRIIVRESDPNDASICIFEDDH